MKIIKRGYELILADHSWILKSTKDIVKTTSRLTQLDGIKKHTRKEQWYSKKRNPEFGVVHNYWICHSAREKESELEGIAASERWFLWATRRFRFPSGHLGSSYFTPTKFSDAVRAREKKRKIVRCAYTQLSLSLSLSQSINSARQALLTINNVTLLPYWRLTCCFIVS